MGTNDHPWDQENVKGRGPCLEKSKVRGKTYCRGARATPQAAGHGRRRSADGRETPTCLSQVPQPGNSYSIQFHPHWAVGHVQNLRKYCYDNKKSLLESQWNGNRNSASIRPAELCTDCAWKKVRVSNKQSINLISLPGTPPPRCV
eukprot:g58577.t1